MKKLVVLTGAGISAESGIQTFRGADGLWEGHDVTEVASPEGWRRNRELVLDFYNQRRKNVLDVEPNRGHHVLHELEANFDVHIITQNIDDLHERAGSSNILHLHGEILKSRSTVDATLVYTMTKATIELGETCEKGSQLRPHIVWFGEAVPMIEPAAELVSEADILVVVGTSMEVYPAAGLTQFAPVDCPIYLIDPNPTHSASKRFKHIVAGGSEGLERLKQELLEKYG
ncbi:MAG: NAD-dependent deacylase [Bacteroidia bacterium]|nr:NAD-dependent deacylase [Bacteroidia bacterium]